MGIFAIFSTIIMAPVAIGGALLSGVFYLMKFMVTYWLPVVIVLGILSLFFDTHPNNKNNK